ncbi:Mu-like prophage major head subunit gpT family protein [Yoonia sp. R2331]|uniref:phage major capsid protein n=1 Tax=Yoonia sp. R2331 TaxID=3237238 RepID=UPI0034E5ACCC
MTTTSGAHPKALWPGVKAFFGKTYDEKPLVCTMVFDEQSSDKSYEERVEETGFGLAPKKAEGAAISYDTDAQGYTSRLTNVVYALGAKITKEAISDNQYEAVAKKKSAKLARSMRHTKENVHANVLNRGFDSAFVGGDGKELFATDHPTMSGTQSNELAVAADMSEASIEDMLTLIRGAKDSRGLRIQLKGMKLIVPAALEFDATRILSSVNQSGTDLNDINAMRHMGMLPGGVVVWDYLTDDDAFFIKTDADEGLIHQKRWALALEQDNDFDTKNACMSAEERYAAGWADWRGVYASPGA